MILRSFSRGHPLLYLRVAPRGPLGSDRTVPPYPPAVPKASAHACPRCAYDLSGEVARWTDRCPTTSICPECGLEVDWRDVLVSKYTFSEWFYETCTTRQLLALRTTTLVSLRPHRFWSRVRLHYPIRTDRAIFAGITGFAWCFAWLMLIATALSLAIMVGLGYARGGGWWIHGSSDLFWPRLLDLDEPGYLLWACIGLVTLIVMPFSMRLLPISLHRIQVRPAHLLRIAAYSGTATALLITGPHLLIRFLSCIMLAVTPLFPIGSGTAELIRDPLGGILNIVFEYERSGTAIALLLWPVLWWWQACKHYLRLPRPLLIASVMGLLSTLAVLTVAVVALRGLAYRTLFYDFGL